VHLNNGHTKPSEHTVVKLVAEATRRILAKPNSRKTPLSALLRILSGAWKVGCLHGDLQVAAFIALGFYGFLRWDDLSHITPEDLVFAPTHLSISLSKRKNDKFREGSQVLIARSDDSPCLVAHSGTGEAWSEDHAPATNPCSTRRASGHKYRREAMSYSRANHGQ
jgi:hypothetical protein